MDTYLEVLLMVTGTGDFVLKRARIPEAFADATLTGGFPIHLDILFEKIFTACSGKHSRMQTDWRTLIDAQFWKIFIMFGHSVLQDARTLSSKVLVNKFQARVGDASGREKAKLLGRVISSTLSFMLNCARTRDNHSGLSPPRHLHGIIENSANTSPPSQNSSPNAVHVPLPLHVLRHVNILDAAAYVSRRDTQATNSTPKLVVAPLHLISSCDNPLDRWRGGHWGMNTTAASATAYTPLEYLLLFQSLVVYGNRDEDFIRISDLLANNALVKDGPTYDAQRLSVDALRQLYIQLLQEELRTEEPETKDDAVQPGSRKRKLPTPPIPSLKDAQQHKDKLPALVDRLYARYRDYMIQAIREDERRFALVQQEIAEIERGEWDERILKEDQAVAHRNGVVPVEIPQSKTNGNVTAQPPILPEAKPVEPVEVQPPENLKPVEVVREPVKEAVPPAEPVKDPPVSVPSKPSPPIVASPRTETRPEGLAITDVLNSQQKPVLAPPQIDQRPPQIRSPQTGPHQIIPPQNGRPQNGPPQNLPSQNVPPQNVVPQNGRPQNGPPQNGHLQNGPQQSGPPPFRPPQNQQTVQHPPPHPQIAQQRPGSNGSHVQHGSPLQPQPSPQQYTWETPYGPQHQPPQYPTASNHPPNHPSPFTSPQYPPNFGLPPRGTFPNQHGLPPPHPHVPSSPSPLNTQHPHTILLPPPNGMGRSPSSPGMPPLDALADIAGQQFRAPSGSPMMQQQQMIAPPVGYQQPYPQQQRPPPSNGQPQWNPQYPPQYHGSPQAYQQFQSPQNPRIPFPPRPDLVAPENRQYTSPYNASQGPKAPVPLVSQNQTPKSRPSQPNTPISQGFPKFKTGSGTRWTPNPTASTPRPNKVVLPPTMEPLSPILRPAKLPVTKKAILRKEQKVEPQKPKQEIEPQKKEQKTEPTKASKAVQRGARRPRGADSPASSVVAASHRSPSVTPHADELSMDNEIANRHVKQEVATPIGIEDAGDTTADEASVLPPHHSRQAPSPRQSVKRKRSPIPTLESRPPSTPPTHVLWTRAFPKISASALESVSGHRNASTFAAPVKEHNAPGYKHLILRPQDLKSIRSAINAGHRAASAAAPPDLGPQTNVMLPISEDLIPPKGIINNAQLEKELMRMFANAIMFNADPNRGFGRRLNGGGKGKVGDIVGYEIDEDGVVKDTRAMFADVEKVITNLRSAERRSEELREASLAAAGTAGTVAGTTAEEDEAVDELAGDGDGSTSNVGSVAKRRRKA
ncbi:hypothetical protein G7Y89_g14275 [Cudoniella acicularis]|uniref:Bromo domain-containing protein n=1 Tax=Cudoniella acicularis TaxID=354080 RepID=A0A8H4VU26_9HELO|nr:hypothetical protein G7Y89_g14275 [Cudoniella acicularis]